ncbi:protein SOB FIVE-LIKE 2-like [Hevea brasiliensis]|uniref:protein SOB FIVE-LIKE 2-like n=1 Tax=Hevea brasiliensis TaxID=3981 RepID=UPI0025E272A5|nr:protein SOB FIVE-LIKE 2-like [Hevea brasiliensis]
MESSQLFGGPEERNSSESGWTMYLGSPINGDDDDDQHGNKDDDDDDDGDGGNGKNYLHEDHSDDSMASDASSGPSHQGKAHHKHLQEGFTF